MRSHAEIADFLAAELMPRLAAEQAAEADVRRRQDAVRLPRALKIAAPLVGAVVAALARQAAPLLLAALPFALEAFLRLRVQGRHCDVRREFVEPLVRFLDPALVYEPKATVTREEVVATGLFSEEFDRLEGGDGVSGHAGRTCFRFRELRLARKRDDGPAREVFRGILFTAEANKHFRGRTYILPDAGEARLGTLARSFQALRGRSFGELVHLEDPAFESAFQVFADDQVEARYLLSPALMGRLLAVRDHWGGELRAVFVAGKLHLALAIPRDFFAVPGAGFAGHPLFAALGVAGVEQLRADHFHVWANDLACIVGLVEELDLNTRIWSKAS